MSLLEARVSKGAALDRMRSGGFAEHRQLLRTHRVHAHESLPHGLGAGHDEAWRAGHPAAVEQRCVGVRRQVRDYLRP